MTQRARKKVAPAALGGAAPWRRDWLGHRRAESVSRGSCKVGRSTVSERSSADFTPAVRAEPSAEGSRVQEADRRYAREACSTLQAEARRMVSSAPVASAGGVPCGDADDLSFLPLRRLRLPLSGNPKGRRKGTAFLAGQRPPR